MIRHDGRARESWVRYHMRLGPLTPLGRLVFYAIAVVVLLGVAWVLVGSTLAGLLMLALAAGP